MRNLIFFSFVLGLSFILLMSSCNKNESDAQLKDSLQAEIRTSNDILNPTATYIYNGIAKTGNQITESETMNVIIEYNGQNYVFDNDISLRNWTFGNSDRTRIRQVLDSINYFKTLENDPNGPTEVEESIVPKGWLYRDLNRQGPTWPIKSYNYGASKNNTASSFLLVLGGAVLCDNKWWGGKKKWLIAIPASWGNLDPMNYNFNDRAESGWDL